MNLQAFYSLAVMKFGQLAALLQLLLVSFGEVDSPNSSCVPTDFQEDCAGCGLLTDGIRMFHLVGARRDVARLH